MSCSQGIFPSSSTVTIYISGTAILLYTLSYLASVAARISVEKDWIVVLCEEDSARLAEVNTNVRTIDLVSNLLAPTLAGILLQHCSYFAAALILVFWVRSRSDHAQITLRVSLYLSSFPLSGLNLGDPGAPPFDGHLQEESHSGQ